MRITWVNPREFKRTIINKIKEFNEFKEDRIKHKDTRGHSKRIKRNTFLKSNNPNIRINKNQEGKS